MAIFDYNQHPILNTIEAIVVILLVIAVLSTILVGVTKLVILIWG